MNTFSISEALKVGWQKTKKNFLLWTGILITMGVVNIVIDGLHEQIDNSLVSALIVIGRYIIQLVFELGMIGIALKLLADQSAKYTDLFAMYPYVPQFLLATIIGGIAIIAGLIVLIIPGIYIALRLSQTPFLIADWKLSGIAALKKSWEITRGYTLQLLFLMIVVCVLNIIGAMLLLIGLLVTIPVTTVAMAYVYRKIAPGAALTPASVSAIAPAEAVA